MMWNYIVIIPIIAFLLVFSGINSSIHHTDSVKVFDNSIDTLRILAGPTVTVTWDSVNKVYIVERKETKTRVIYEKFWFPDLEGEDK